MKTARINPCTTPNKILDGQSQHTANVATALSISSEAWGKTLSVHGAWDDRKQLLRRADEFRRSGELGRAGVETLLRQTCGDHGWVLGEAARLALGGTEKASSQNLRPPPTLSFEDGFATQEALSTPEQASPWELPDPQEPWDAPED